MKNFDKILNYLNKKTNKPKDILIKWNTDLTSGILDSLEFFQFILFLEKTFNVSFAKSNLKINFKNANMIKKIIKKYKNEKRTRKNFKKD